MAGVCFSPDGSTLFVNIQVDGLTVAITGPFPEMDPGGDGDGDGDGDGGDGTGGDDGDAGETGDGGTGGSGGMGDGTDEGCACDVDGDPGAQGAAAATTAAAVAVGLVGRSRRAFTTHDEAQPERISSHATDDDEA